MGSHARAKVRFAAALFSVSAGAAALLAAGSAHAGGMDLTPERLVLQPNGLPTGVSCQQFAANAGAFSAKTSTPASSLACLPDNIAFKNLISELGFALAPSVMHPARTVGFGGFVLSLEASYTSINADGYSAGNGFNNASKQYWHLGTQGSTDAAGNYSTVDNSPDSLIGVYSLMVRKGLPFGFELDGALGYVQNTSLWTIGADVRWALLEGFRTGVLGYFPDFALGSGVRTMTGTSKVYLTTVGFDAEISKPITLADEAQITPYGGFQHLMIYGNSAVVDATPSVDALTQCGYGGRQTSGISAGQPACSNKIPGAQGSPAGSTQDNSVDFNNYITFDPVRINR
ncbi:MAG TPA: hypothetical protein VGI39_05360, partial [Polyangiaceae bacterium]